MEQPRQATILVVDNDEYSRRLLVAELGTDGYAVHCAASGEEALATVAAQLPDLILLDILMQDIDGFEVTRRLKADARSRLVPIILLTVLENSESRLKGLEAGADEFLTKPVERTELLVRVRNMLNVKKCQDFLADNNLTLKEQVDARTAELQESEAHYRRITEELTDYLYTVRIENGCAVETTHSKGCVTVTGYTADEFAANPQLWIQMVVPEDRDLVREHAQHILAGNDGKHIEHRITRKDGETRWVSDTTILFKDASGKLLSYDGVIKDITERKQAEEAQNASALKYRLLFESSRDALMLLAPPSWKFTGANQATLQLFGASSVDEFTSLGPWDVSPSLQPDGRPSSEKAQEMIATAMREGSHFFEWEHQRLDGQPFAADVLLTCMKIDKDVFLQATVRDITERKLAQTIYNLAFYDTLTQLPNRRLLNDRLEQAMVASKRSGRYGALMFLDLDNFKPLNDTYGHDVGDLLLVDAAHRLTSCMREMDTVARFGGDEFMVMLGELAVDKAESVTQAGIVAEKIRATLAEPYMLKLECEVKMKNTVEHHCTTSIGVVLFINHEARTEEIMKWADMAMYQAKEAGGNLIRFYDTQSGWNR